MRSRYKIIKIKVEMNLFFATLLLSIERFTYGYLWQLPDSFRKISKVFGYNKPTEFIYLLTFYYKFFNGYVFISWYLEQYGYNLPETTPIQLVLSILLFSVGQFLNVMTWRAIGKDGVCYGDRFGMKIPWCSTFPYNVTAHPQYIGAICTFWGIFIPFWSKPTWYKLPLLETVLYINSAFLWEHD